MKGKLDKLILEVLERASRPVTAREIALDVERVLGSSVDRKKIDHSLRAGLREFVLKDACWRWRLACRSDLTDTLPRSTAHEPLARQHAKREQEAWAEFKDVLSHGGHHHKPAKKDPELEALLQWATELDAEKRRLQAEIDEAGGNAEVWVLRDISGREIPAKVVNGKHSAEWVLLDGLGHRTRTHLPYRPLQQADLQKKGYMEACERRPATAMIIFARTGARWPRVEAVIKPAVPAASQP